MTVFLYKLLKMLVVAGWRTSNIVSHSAVANAAVGRLGATNFRGGLLSAKSAEPLHNADLARLMARSAEGRTK